MPFPDAPPGQFPDRFPDQFPDRLPDQVVGQAPGGFPAQAPFFTAGGFQTELPPPYPPPGSLEPGYGDSGMRFPAAAHDGPPTADHPDGPVPYRAAPTEFWPARPDQPEVASHLPAGQFPGEQFPGGQFPGGQFPGEQFPSEQFPSGQLPAQQFPGGQPDFPSAYRPDLLPDRLPDRMSDRLPDPGPVGGGLNAGSEPGQGDPPDYRSAGPLSPSGLPMRQAGVAYDAAADGRDDLDLPYPPSRMGPRTGFELPAVGYPPEPSGDPTPAPVDQWPASRPNHPDPLDGHADLPDRHTSGYESGRSWESDPGQREDSWAGGSWGTTGTPARPTAPTGSAWDKLPVPPRPAPSGRDDGADLESTQFHPGPDYGSAPDYPPAELAEDLAPRRPGPNYPPHPQFTPADREQAPYDFGEGYPGRP